MRLWAEDEVAKREFESIPKRSGSIVRIRTRLRWELRRKEFESHGVFFSLR